MLTNIYRYDTIIKTASSNSLNDMFFSLVVDILNPNFAYDDIFIKREANEIYYEFINSKWYKNVVKLTGNKALENIFYTSFLEMSRNNNNIFSYRFIKPAYRKYIPLAIKLNSDLEISDNINDKDILILDDTVTTGLTLSQEANLLLNTYAPKSVEFLSILSPLNNREIK